MIEVDRQVDSVTGGRNFKFAIVSDIRPIITEEHFNYIAIPKTDAVFAVVRREKQIQHRVRAFEQDIEITIGPESAHRRLEIWVVNLAAAVFRHELDGSTAPGISRPIERQRRLAGDMMNAKTGRRLSCNARLLGGKPDSKDE